MSPEAVAAIEQRAVHKWYARLPDGGFYTQKSAGGVLLAPDERDALCAAWREERAKVERAMQLAAFWDGSKQAPPGPPKNVGTHQMLTCARELRAALADTEDTA